MRKRSAPIAWALIALSFGLYPILVAPADALAQAAQEAPFLVLRIQSEMGFRLQDRKAGLGGAVYVLNRAQDRAETRTQSVQIAYDARNRPTLLRLTQRIETETAGDAFIDAARASMARVRPKETNPPVDLIRNTLQAALQDHAAAAPVALPFIGGGAGTLSYLADRKVAVLDIPIAVSDARHLTEQELRTRLADTTMEFPGSETSGRDEHRRYHGPDGRFGGGRLDGQTTESGTWTLTPDGRYCVEDAPNGRETCSGLYEIADDGLYLVAAPPDGAAGGDMTVARIDLKPGNPGAFRTPRRADAVPQPVAEMIVRGQTEDRRYPDGRHDSLFMMRDGTFRGLRAGEPATGHWTILKDGRRCLTDGETGESECVFLSETDGGTFRLYDIDRTLLGEAVYRDGNPEAY